MTDLSARLQAALSGAYRIDHELGGGGMSRVFLAEEVALGRKVVIKVLPPEMGAGVNADRFRREIQLAASLQHPHIVPLLSAGQNEDLVWYSMPLIEGESLRARLARERELPVADAVRLLRDVADALAYAHAHGVVHRDIKPDNVLISGHHAVVTDFGVAKAISAATGESHLTSIGVALGTPAYMSPEQAAAEPHVDHRADLYALGAMAYEMLTGAPPFAGAAQLVLAAHVTQSPEPVSAKRAAVPPALATIVMRCLEKKAADRWQSAEEVHQQLEVMATPSGGMTPTGAVPVTRPTPGVRRRWLVPTAAALVLVALAAAGLVLWRSRGNKTGTADVREPVLVLPFETRVTSPGLKDVGQLAADRIEAGIEAAALGTVKQRRSVVGASEGGVLSPDELNRIAKSSGAATLVTGVIDQRGDTIEVQPRVLRARDLKTIFSLRAERGPATDPGRAVDAAKERLLGAMAFYLSEDFRTYDAALYTPPSSLELFRLWNRADQFLYQADFARAIPVYQEVVRRDPSQPLPALWLAAAYRNAGSMRESDSILRSMEPARLSRGESVLLDMEQAWNQSPEDEWRAATAAFQVDPRCYGLWALAASVRTNHLSEAPRFYGMRDTLSASGRGWLWWYRWEADALHGLGRYAEELSQAREARQRDPASAATAYMEGRALIALGQMAELEQVLTASRALPDFRAPGSLMSNLAFEVFEHRGKDEAARMRERVLAWAEGLPPDRRQDRAVQERMAVENLYLERYTEAGTLFADLAKRYPDVPLYLDAGARIAARQGDTATALRRIEELQRDTVRNHGLDIARINALLGRKEEAVAALRDFLNRGGRYNLGGFHGTSLELVALRDYPPFMALVAPKAQTAPGSK